jgi:hypothetical protein
MTTPWKKWGPKFIYFAVGFFFLMCVIYFDKRTVTEGAEVYIQHCKK